MQKLAIFKSVKTTRQLKSWLLICLVVLSNAIAFYSAVLAQPAGPVPPVANPPPGPVAAQPAGPPAPAPTVAIQPPGLAGLPSAQAAGLIPPRYTPSPSPPTTMPQNGVNNIPTPLQNGVSNTALNQLNTAQQYSSLVTQAAEQDKQSWSNILTNTLTQNLVLSTNNRGNMNTSAYQGIQAIIYYTLGGGWIPELGWLFAQWTQQFVQSWLGPTIGNFFIARLIGFKDVLDVSYQTDQFSINMRSLNHLVRNFAFDLLLLFFILAIWRNWANAVWGNGRIWGTVGRLIAATAAVIAWPEIYHYTIMIGNVASDLFVQNMPSSDQLGNDVVGFFYNAISFPATQKSGYVIPFQWVIELIVNLAIAIAMVVSLIAYFIEKAIQLTLIVMAYVFAPFFLVCLVSPDTEDYASSFVKMFAEAVGYNFLWGGLIQIMMYVIEQGVQANSPIYQFANGITAAATNNSVTSNPANPWFVLLLILGILQAMLQVPHYISRGHVGAKFGILELGFASWMGKRAVSALWGTSGLYTQMRHAWWDTKSHRWPVNLPKTPSLANINSNVGAGQSFAAANLDVPSPAGAVMGGGGGVFGGGGGGGLFGGGGGGGGGGRGGGQTSFVAAQSGDPAPMRAPTNIDTMEGVQSQTSPVATMMQRIRLFGDHHIDQKGGTDKKGRFTFDQMGGIDDIIMPKGATKEQKALTMAAASFINVVDERGNIDPGFEDALWYDKVMRSRSLGGPLNPLNPYGLYGQVQPTLLDKIALWLDNGRPSQAYKDILGYRNSRWNNKMIARGVSAYINGDTGQKSAIAGYWSARRGPFDAAQQIHRLTNPLALAGGVNTVRLEAMGALIRANVESTKTTRTAASHPAVLRARTTDRPEYVQSLVRLLQESAAVHFGSDAVGRTSDQLVNFYDGIMPHIEDDHVQAATAITRNHGIQYVTPENVYNVLKYKRDRGLPSDRNSFDDSARAIQMAANYHDYVGRLNW